MMWDLNYFKYHFIKLSGLNFDEQQLEDDFESLAGYLNQAPRHFFMFRDFQSRNIMVRDDRVFFIDFQGGRMGYPAYDLASLLFDAKAELSPWIREKIQGVYMDDIIATGKIQPDEFMRYYPGFVLIRKMQAMGAFGFRGIIERKAHFLQSIPPAMKNLDWVINNYRLELHIPELWRILSVLPGSPFVRKVEEQIEQL
jgi:aminoglycoside/choline kinase family phosphotransferase